MRFIECMPISGHAARTLAILFPAGLLDRVLVGPACRQNGHNHWLLRLGFAAAAISIAWPAPALAGKVMREE